MTMQREASGCAWCALPRAKKGIVVGIVASLTNHVAIAGVVSHFDQAIPEVKPKIQARVIELGTIVIHRAPQRQALAEQQEL